MLHVIFVIIIFDRFEGSLFFFETEYSIFDKISELIFDFKEYSTYPSKNVYFYNHMISCFMLIFVSLLKTKKK